MEKNYSPDEELIDLTSEKLESPARMEGPMLEQMQSPSRMEAPTAGDSESKYETILKSIQTLKSCLLANNDPELIKNLRSDVKNLSEKLDFLETKLEASQKLAVYHSPSGGSSPSPYSLPVVLDRQFSDEIHKRELSNFLSVNVNVLKEMQNKQKLEAMDKTERDEAFLKAIEQKNIITSINCIRAGCDINRKVMEGTAYGKTFLQFIMETTDDDFAMAILNKVEVNLGYKTPQKKNYLHIAAERDLPQCINYLLTKSNEKIDLDEEDILGYSPIHYTATKVSEKALRQFLNFKFNTSKKIKSTNDNVLTILGNMAFRSSGMEIVGDNCIKYQNCVTLLIQTDHLETSQVNTRPNNQTENTPLHHAAAMGTLQIIQQLVELKARPEPNADEKNPLFIASERGRCDILKFLIESFKSNKKNPVDIDLPDKYGNTCLHAAARRCKKQPGAINCVELLLDHGAMLSRKNSDNVTPLDQIFESVQEPESFLQRTFNNKITAQTGETVEKAAILNFDILNPQSGGIMSEMRTNNMVLDNLVTQIVQEPLNKERKQLMVHPLVESFILFKWIKIKAPLYIQFGITLLFAFGYSVFSSSKCSIFLKLDEKRITIKALTTIPILPVLLFLLILFEIFLAYGRGLKNLRGHLGQLSLAFVTFTLCIINMASQVICSEEGFRDVAAISILLLWLYTFLILSISPHIGKDTLIFYKVGKKLLELIIAYSPILIGFGIAFSIAVPHGRGGGPSEMGFPLIAMNTMVALLMGEYELMDRFPGPVGMYNQTTNTTNSPYSNIEFWSHFNYTAHIIFFLFVFMVSIVVSNILIAFALKDVELVLKDVKIRMLLSQADYIRLFETGAVSKYIDFTIKPKVRVIPGKDGFGNLYPHPKDKGFVPTEIIPGLSHRDRRKLIEHAIRIGEKTQTKRSTSKPTAARRSQNQKWTKVRNVNEAVHRFSHPPSRAQSSLSIAQTGRRRDVKDSMV